VCSFDSVASPAVRWLRGAAAAYVPHPETVKRKQWCGYNGFNVFARKICVEYQEKGLRHPCPLKWLDSFSMRNFTNASVFDDTLPIADGTMEIGAKVPLDELKAAMEDWFRRKSYLPKDARLLLTEG